MVQRVFFGKITNEKNKGLFDLSKREIGLMIPLLFLMVFMGVYPKPILKASHDSVVAIQKIVKGETKNNTIAKEPDTEKHVKDNH